MAKSQLVMGQEEEFRAREWIGEKESGFVGAKWLRGREWIFAYQLTEIQY